MLLFGRIVSGSLLVVMRQFISNEQFMAEVVTSGTVAPSQEFARLRINILLTVHFIA